MGWINLGPGSTESSKCFFTFVVIMWQRATELYWNWTVLVFCTVLYCVLFSLFSCHMLVLGVVEFCSLSFDLIDSFVSALSERLSFPSASAAEFWSGLTSSFRRCAVSLGCCVTPHWNRVSQQCIYGYCYLVLNALNFRDRMYDFICSAILFNHKKKFGNNCNTADVEAITFRRKPLEAIMWKKISLPHCF